MTTAHDLHDLDPQAETWRARMFAFVEAHGVSYASKVVDITGPPGECWTNAWDAHLATGRIYVEGVCILRGRLDAHAWTVDDAGIVYEHTEGYERAGAYRGFPFNTAPGSHAVVVSARVYEPGEPRTSMLEGVIAAGADRPSIIRNFGRPA
jgi:hypothetical protein